jgi:minor extracellular protease Epr
MSLPRVVVVDSGVDAQHPALRGRATVTAGPDFLPAGDDAPNGDLLGHGTAVAATIVRLAPGIELHSLRVFGRTPTCDFVQVLAAVEHALSLRPTCINLSLGTTSLRHHQALRRLLGDAAAIGCRIIAPASYAGLPSAPGSLTGCEAVVGDPNLLPHAPELRPAGGRLVWFASPLPPPDADGLRRLTARGDSLAVAAVTGRLVASLLR